MKTKRQLQIEEQAITITGGTHDSVIVSAFCVGAFWADKHPEEKDYCGDCSYPSEKGHHEFCHHYVGSKPVEGK